MFGGGGQRMKPCSTDSKAEARPEEIQPPPIIHRQKVLPEIIIYVPFQNVYPQPEASK